MTFLEAVENEIIERWGEYKGAPIPAGDTWVRSCCDKFKDQVDYTMYCSRQIMQLFYEDTLRRGFSIVTCTCDRGHGFITGRQQPKDLSGKYKFPKIGVIQVIERLSQGYIVQKEGEEGYHVDISEKLRSTPL